MSKFHYLFFTLFILLAAIALAINHVKESDLASDFSVTSGHYVGFSRGVKTGGGIRFSYLVGGQRYVEKCKSPSVSCQKNLFLYDKILKSKSWVVLYERGNPENSEILIFLDQYKKYGLEVPDSLYREVRLLSDCTN